MANRSQSDPPSWQQCCVGLAAMVSASADFRTTYMHETLSRGVDFASSPLRRLVCVLHKAYERSAFPPHEPFSVDLTPGEYCFGE